MDKYIINPIEKDPFGKSSSEGGAKLDDGKILGGVLADFNKALLAVAEVGTAGAIKYSRGGWITVPNGEQRYYDAMWRHLLADGMYDIDPGGTNLLHLSQVAWNALATLQVQLKRGVSNRYEG